MDAKLLKNKDENIPEALRGLNPRQKKFAELYAVNGNALKSARLAGYATDKDETSGYHVLYRSPGVAEAVEYYRELFASECHYTPEKIIKEWAQMASVDVSAFVDEDWDLKPKSALTEAQRASLVGLEVIEKKGGRTVKPKFAKVEALKELGKLLGMYTDNDTDKRGMDLHINIGTQVNVDGEGISESAQVGHLRINKATSAE
jgi:hypothetical protein